MSSPACPDRELLLALADGRLSGDALEAVARHIDSCPECLARMQQLEPGSDRVVRALRGDAGGTTGPPATINDAPARPDTAPRAPAPSVRYRPLSFHAQGGLGEVHLARDEELGREVALKRIRPARADDAENRRRFLKEAEITARLEHPGIVPVYGLAADDSGQPGYAMRFIRGETLMDAIRRFHEADRTRASEIRATSPPVPRRWPAVARARMTRSRTNKSAPAGGSRHWIGFAPTSPSGPSSSMAATRSSTPPRGKHSSTGSATATWPACATRPNGGSCPRRNGRRGGCSGTTWTNYSSGRRRSESGCQRSGRAMLTGRNQDEAHRLPGCDDPFLLLRGSPGDYSPGLAGNHRRVLAPCR